jgi:hypothetical protein
MMRVARQEQFGLVGYGIVVGVGASAVGAWASSPVSGSARIGTWIIVTGVLASALAWFAESAVLVLTRWLRYGFGRGPFPR